MASLWDLPHSTQSFNSGLWDAKHGGTRFKALTGGDQPGPGRLYWPSAALQAFNQARGLWKQPMAVEYSMLFGGLGCAITPFFPSSIALIVLHALKEWVPLCCSPWRSDMSPLGDEGTFGGLSQCLEKSGGPGMHRDLLLSIIQEGATLNAYNTQLPRFPDVESLVRCSGLQFRTPAAAATR